MTSYSVSVVWTNGYHIKRSGNRRDRKACYFVENTLIRGKSLIDMHNVSSLTVRRTYKHI